MNYTEKSGWAPWYVDGSHGSYLGGYRVEYDHNFTFVTVRGAGHMVRTAAPMPTTSLLPISPAMPPSRLLAAGKSGGCFTSLSLSPPPCPLLAGPGDQARGET